MRRGNSLLILSPLAANAAHILPSAVYAPRIRVFWVRPCIVTDSIYRNQYSIHVVKQWWLRVYTEISTEYAIIVTMVTGSVHRNQCNMCPGYFQVSETVVVDSYTWETVL